MQLESSQPKDSTIDPDIGSLPWQLKSQTPITFTHAKVVDPETGELVENVTLKLRDGRVTSLEQTTDGDASDSESLRGVVLDARDFFVCPGLIDCHVHLTDAPGVTSLAEYFSLPRETSAWRTAWVLKGMLSRGFTTVRDVGGATKAHANATADWLTPGPRIFQGGPLVSQTGGHGDKNGPNPVPSTCCDGKSGDPRAPGRLVDGVPEALYAAREIMRAGADHIKICTSGGVASETDALDSLQMTLEEVKAITGVVRAMRGALVTSHCYTVEGILHAIEGGVGGIEHGNFLDRPTAQLMAEKGIYLTPTLSIHDILTRPPYSTILTPDQLARNEIVRKAGLQALTYAEEAGVCVCYGTDMQSDTHHLQCDEFATRAKVLPSPVVLKHATVNAAKQIKMEGRLGRLIPGAYADLLLLRRNPLEDVTVLSDPSLFAAVIKDGRVVRSAADELAVEIPLR